LVTKDTFSICFSSDGSTVDTFNPFGRGAV